MDRTLYSKAPITEALIDIRITPSSSAKVEDLNILKTSLKDYPNVKKQIENQIQLGIGDNQSSQQVVKEIGLRFDSSNNLNVLQAKTSGFTFSRLQPYERWENFIAEAKSLWDEYSKVVKPVSYNRYAVRFINRFDIPNDRIELADYFNVYPQAPQNYDLTGFYSQISIAQLDIGAELSLSQAVIPPVKDNHISIVLDLDLFINQPISDNVLLWKEFEILHKRKNKIFEELITEKTRELIR